MSTFRTSALWIIEKGWTKSYTVTLILAALTLANGQERAYLSGDSIILPCARRTVSQGPNYVWTDVDDSIVIYSIASAGVTDKSFDARQIEKYNNFDVDNQYPDSVDLKINVLDFNDGGTYSCSLFTEAAPPDITVIVEALPTSLSVACTTLPPDECSEPVGDSSEFTCACTAVGAYPDDLHFEWTNAVGDPVPTSIEPSSNRSGAFDYTGIATFVPTDTENTVTCSLGGYNGSWSVPHSRYTVGPPGKCNISVSCNNEATVATLTCSCPNGVPDNPSYTYYNETGAVVTSEVSVTPGVQFTVGCRGCNGVNYGEDTFISKTETCTVTTVTTSAIPTKAEGTPTDPTGAPVALIASLSVCGVILIIVVIIGAICFLKNRDGDSNKKPDDDSVNDFGNKETPAVYAVPDKNKKSDKPDGNGAGPESDMPTYADVNKPPQPTAAPRTSQKVPDDQPMQELQYADLDHGKQQPTNEIRKPQEEPTEYATVQSVIV